MEKKEALFVSFLDNKIACFSLCMQFLTGSVWTCIYMTETETFFSERNFFLCSRLLFIALHIFIQRGQPLTTPPFAHCTTSCDCEEKVLICLLLLTTQTCSHQELLNTRSIHILTLTHMSFSSLALSVHPTSDDNCG